MGTWKQAIEISKRQETPEYLKEQLAQSIKSLEFFRNAGDMPTVYQIKGQIRLLKEKLEKMGVSCE